MPPSMRKPVIEINRSTSTAAAAEARPQQIGMVAYGQRPPSSTHSASPFDRQLSFVRLFLFVRRLQVNEHSQSTKVYEILLMTEGLPIDCSEKYA